MLSKSFGRERDKSGGRPMCSMVNELLMEATLADGIRVCVSVAAFPLHGRPAISVVYVAKRWCRVKANLAPIRRMFALSTDHHPSKKGKKVKVFVQPLRILPFRASAVNSRFLALQLSVYDTVGDGHKKYAATNLSS